MPLLDPGTYPECKLTEAVFGINEKKTPQMCLVFDIGHGESRNVLLYLSDAAEEYSIETLQKLGFNGDFKDPKFREDVYTVGIDLFCKHEEYDGKVRDKWQISTGGWKPDAAPPDLVSRMNARWKAKAGVAPRPSGSPSKPPARNGPAGGPPKKGMSEEECWAVWLREFSGDPDEKRDAAYWEAVEKIGKPIENFTPTDWASLAKMCPKIPI